MGKTKETPAVSSLLTPAQLRAQDEGELRRQAFLATLDPRQRGDLDPKGDG
jgi:hypothetical protein